MKKQTKKTDKMLVYLYLLLIIALAVLVTLTLNFNYKPKEAKINAEDNPSNIQYMRVKALYNWQYELNNTQKLALERAIFLDKLNNGR